MRDRDGRRILRTAGEGVLYESRLQDIHGLKEKGRRKTTNEEGEVISLGRKKMRRQTKAATMRVRATISEQKKQKEKENKEKGNTDTKRKIPKKRGSLCTENNREGPDGCDFAETNNRISGTTEDWATGRQICPKRADGELSSLDRTSAHWRLVLAVWCIPLDFAQTCLEDFGCNETNDERSRKRHENYCRWMEIRLTDVDVILRARLHPCCVYFIGQSLPFFRVHLSADSMRLES